MEQKELLTAAELDVLRARLSPADRLRLRPGGLLEPKLGPWQLCGGLQSPYLVLDADPVARGVSL